jgi:hypothetical protein
MSDITSNVPCGKEVYSIQYSDIIQSDLYVYEYVLENGFVFQSLSYTLEQCRDKRDYFFANFYYPVAE